MTAPGFDLTSSTKPPYLSESGTTSTMLGPGPQRWYLDVMSYGPMAVLDPWLGSTDEQRLAIRAGTPVLMNVSVNCYDG
ncbi:hypothetical protein [Nocardia sp. bgisy134]|uniref:hypothetical protein n=1 Tax=Nocardia sp. bgisy134 TaxID=3413789 RepID=UPI003D7242F9